MWTSLFFTILVIIFALFHCEKIIKPYNLQCDGNTKYLDNVTCHLKPLRRDFVIANLDGDIIDTLKNISVRYRAFKYYTQFRPFMVDISFNWCEIIHNKYLYGFYANQLMRVLKKYCNIIHCQLRGHIYAKDLQLNYDAIKIFVDESRYKLLFEFFEGYPQEYLGNITIFFEVYNKFRKPAIKKKTNSTL
ncbi:hypothetical protein ACFFRR_006867 [Megaselia abdita]